MEIKDLLKQETVWYEGKEYKILGINTGAWIIKIDKDKETLVSISDISLTPPKQKKKYWLWAVRNNKNEAYHVSDWVLDEEGNFSNGDKSKAWEQGKERIKLENTMIEVEE